MTLLEELKKINKIEVKRWLKPNVPPKRLKLAIIYAYYLGMGIHEICAKSGRDVMSVLQIIDDACFSEEQMRLIRHWQEDYGRSTFIDRYETKTTQLIFKYFPSMRHDNNNRYWININNNIRDTINRHKRCIHDITHIQCAKCGKIIK